MTSLGSLQVWRSVSPEAIDLLQKLLTPEVEAWRPEKTQRLQLETPNLMGGSLGLKGGLRLKRWPFLLFLLVSMLDLMGCNSGL